MLTRALAGAAAGSLLLAPFAAVPASAVETAQPTPYAYCVNITGMNWGGDTRAFFRLTNTCAEEVTGTAFVVRGAARQPVDVTMAAKQTRYISFTGDRNKAVTAAFEDVNGGYKQNGINKSRATIHVGIDVAAEGDLAALPDGFTVVATSTVETITWTWVSSLQQFTAEGDFPTLQQSPVDQTKVIGDWWYLRSNPDDLSHGTLDVPFTESYTITHDELPAGVTIDIEKDPSSIAFDPALLDEDDFVDNLFKTGKTPSQSVVVKAEDAQPEPEPEPEPEPTPDPEPTPEPEPGVDPEGEIEPEPAPETGVGGQGSELPQTGGSLAAFGVAAGAGALGALLTTTAGQRRRQI